MLKWFSIMYWIVLELVVIGGAIAGICWLIFSKESNEGMDINDDVIDDWM